MRNFDSCRGIVHVIRRGDSLYSISRRYNVPLALIMRANPYVDVYNLQIGDEICVPTNNMGGIGNIGTGNRPSGTVPPNMPGQPTRPSQPSMPEQPTRPSQPSMPEQPTRPSQPSMPSQPTRPSQPNMQGNMNLFTYIIKDAETLKDILDKFDIDLEEFIESNNMSTILLQPGMTVNIPDRRQREEED
ncbi:LysM peptidoglycan-binding domain-containing protein [Anaerosporobacter sp.]